MKIQTSAGGVVCKKESNEVFVLVCQHSQHHGWVFPKGLIGDHVKGEKKEETAIREVKEETGIKAEIIRPLSPITYWYRLDNEKIKKTVYYFLMKFISGNTKDRDMEMENVEWLNVDEVEKRLTYKSDKEVWQEAKLAIGLLSLAG